MEIRKKIALFFMLWTVLCSHAQSKQYVVHTVAFYNFENFFDTINNTNKNDEEWLPNGKQKWTSTRYHQKLHNLAVVLSQIGTNEKQKSAPTFIGGAEIENRNVLEDLIKEPQLIDSNYGIIHYESPDNRGIDVAMLYQKNYFQPISSKNIPLLIYKNQIEKTKAKSDVISTKNSRTKISQKRVYTRDVLLVTGFLEDEEITLIINHWPSRSGGEKKSAPYRVAAAQQNKKIMDSLYHLNPDAKIIIMGDFNDSVTNKSIKKDLNAKRHQDEVKKHGLYNPFEDMYFKGNATIFYHDSGDIFDQIMLSESLIHKDYSTFEYWKAGIYNKPFMIQNEGRYKGYPKRTTPSEVGYSDHFPVFIYLIKEIK